MNVETFEDWTKEEREKIITINCSECSNEFEKYMTEGVSVCYECYKKNNY